jgi:hypothetical protein
MYFGGSMLHRSGRSLWLWLAWRSVLTSVTAAGAAVVLRTAALPALSREIGAMDLDPASMSVQLLKLAKWLPLVGVPGVVFGVAALVNRQARPVLSVLAALASVAAMVAVVGTLIGILVPLYQSQIELAVPK